MASNGSATEKLSVGAVTVAIRMRSLSDMSVRVLVGGGISPAVAKTMAPDTRAVDVINDKNNVREMITVLPFKYTPEIVANSLIWITKLPARYLVLPYGWVLVFARVKMPGIGIANPGQGID